MKIEDTEPPCHWTHPHDAHDWLPIVQDPEAPGVLHVGMASVRCPGVPAEPVAWEALAEAERTSLEQRLDLLADENRRLLAAILRAEALANSWEGEAQAGRAGHGHPLLVQTYDGHARDLHAALDDTPARDQAEVRRG